jgi:putative ABC transport system ATP-binding protein
MPPPAIHAETLTATLRDGTRRFRVVADGLSVAAGEAVALTGPSGSGKTCLLELLGLLRRPDAPTDCTLSDGAGGSHEIGALWADGDTTRLAQLRGRALGFVPQTGALLPYLTLRENVGLAQRITGRVDPDRIDRLASRLGIGDVLDLQPESLSIGQRQRGAIARALAHRPALVLADEPTAALDPEAADDAMAMIVEAASEEGAAILISSHDVALIRRHATRILALTPGSEDDTVTSRLGAAMAPRACEIAS